MKEKKSKTISVYEITDSSEIKEAARNTNSSSILKNLTRRRSTFFLKTISTFGVSMLVM